MLLCVCEVLKKKKTFFSSLGYHRICVATVVDVLA